MIEFTARREGHAIVSETRYVPDSPPEVVKPRLEKERVNETRYVRTFTRDEVLKILRDEVLVEGNRSSYEFERASIEIVSPALADNVTVKVTMKEQAGHY